MDVKKIIDKLNVICQVLNNVEVCGKQNLINIAGSIEAIEEIVAEMLKTEEK